MFRFCSRICCFYQKKNKILHLAMVKIFYKSQLNLSKILEELIFIFSLMSSIMVKTMFVLTKYFEEHFWVVSFEKE